MKKGKALLIALLAVFIACGATYAAKEPDGPENLGSNTSVEQAFPEDPLASGETLTVGEVLQNSQVADERALAITADIVMAGDRAELREQYVALVRDQNYTLLVAVRPDDDIDALIGQFNDPALIRALAGERRIIFDEVAPANYDAIQANIIAALDRGEMPTLNNLSSEQVAGLKSGV